MANTINSTNNLTSTKIPELYIRYFNPKQKVNETVSIKYYVSDSTQAEYLNKDDSKTFTTIVKIKDKTYSKTTKAGEYSIDIGSIANTGETYFSIYTIDDNGVASIEQFFDILIVNDSYNQVNNYNMTTADLSTYNITIGETASITQAKANNTGLNNLFKAVKNNGHNKITMLNKVYMLDYHSDKVVLPDHFTLDMNGATFKATQCNDINVSNLVDLKDCFDSHVKNGKLIGNYDGFDFEATKTNTNYNIPGEGLAVAEINGARYSSFENMEMGYSVGYNLGVFGGKLAGYVGTPGKLAFPNAYYINDQGNTVSSTTMSTTELIDISTLLDRGEIQCNVYLGYGGLALNKAELFFHFYDSQSAYKTTIKSRQYQVVKIPSGTKYLRITGFTPTTTSSGMTICHTGGATNCELINIKSYNTRTCAMHPGIYNHLLIKNCSFNYVADENEYKVTKLALDFEDGYENGKNLFFINNEVYNGTSALTIQRAFNSNVINCRNFGLDIRGHIKGGLIKNNFFNDGSIYTTSFESQSHIKLHNNTFLKVLKFLKWDDKGDYSTIGLTKLDCKQSYQNNSNINVIIDKAVESSGGGGTTPTTLTISNISNITQTANTEFYIQYSTNIVVTKHEISWDGGSTFYDKTEDVVVNGTSYKFKHDNKANAGTYKMAIRVTTASGVTKTSNIFTVTLVDKNQLTFTQYKRLNEGVITDTTDGTYYTTLNYINVTAGKSYTLNLNKANYVCVCYYNSSNSYVSYAESNTDDWSNKELSYTFTIPANVTKMLICATGDLSTAITGALKENTSSGTSGLLDSTGAYVIDDFSGSSVDLNKWGYELGYVRNGETQKYTNTNAEINNGILALRGKKASDGSWTSASIISKGHFAFMYGKIVARVRACNYNGAFGAFWTLGDSFEFGYKENSNPDTLGEWWAYCGEFDVMEFYNGKLTCGTFFNEKEESGRVWYNNYPTGDWHEFAMEWNTDGSLVFSIDGHELSRTSATDNRAFHIPHFILLNQAIGASGGTPDSNTTEITQYVDWVKYYPLSTDNLVENSSDFSLTAMDWNDNSHNCMVRPTFNDNCINKSLTWSSSNSSLVSCHSGLCATYSGANGEVVITGTSHSGVSKQITLTVSNGTLRAKSSDTYYTIRYYLHDSTSSNTSTSIKKGSSYSTTITPKNGYRVNSISCMMGGNDVSNLVVSGTAVNIPNVTGDVSVLVDTEAISTPEPSTIGNMTNGKGINQSTHIITDNAECWATINPVTVEKGATYTLQMDGTWVWGYAFDDSDNYVSELFTSTGNNNYTYTFTAPTTKIRYGCYDPGKYLTYCNLTKTSSGTTTLTISNIANITKPEKTEFYISYSTNRAVAKHEVSWDGGNTFYDKTSDVTSSGTNYQFKHDNSATAGTYRMAIRVTDSNGNTKTSNVFSVTLTSTSTPEPSTPTPVYELADTVFDGSSKYVDTGVKPFKTASDYTIFIDFDDYGASQGQQPYLFHCAYENADGDGLKVYYNNEDNHYYIIGNRQNASDGTYESSWTLVGGKNNKIAIAISKGVVSQIVINGSAVAVTKNAYDMNDYSLILGAYQDAQCNKSKYWKGTIHTFKVWDSAFTVAQLKELCNSSSGGGSNPGGGDSGSSDAYRPGRTLIWEDDFTGTTLNRANWDYENNYSRPNEVQNYVAGTNNVWVENSNLVIKAKKESSNGKEWSSGCIHTDNKREFMYGRFEAKIKIPQTVGSFPAFWTLGGNYEEGGGITWPYCGEIDIMEHKYGYAWTTAGALYRTDLVWDNWDAKDLGRVDSGNIGSFDDYHIYAMEWTHDKLDYYVDDRLIGHSDISDDNTWFMFHQPHYILLNQALGAAGGSVPSNMTEYTMYVDWVRVYAPEEAPSGGGTSNQIWFEDTSARHMEKWSKLGLILKFNESWTNKVITWKSSNESIATVCGGRVDSKGVDGTCIITATTLEGNSASITVNVGSGGSSSDSTEYETSTTSAYILDKMYPMPQNHEALPSGVNDTWATQSRWENQQRPTAMAHNCGQANCPGAVAFKALGAWANVYRVKNSGFSANTGVEMRNIKVYGWYNGQWEKVQDLAVPNGNFYAESFSGDSNTYFSDSIKTTSTSKTIILREANKINNENCMYHPFSDIKNFDTKYQYVYTCIDLRKVKWNESGTDDRDSSHYCASCGGDWWLAEGLTFDSSWQHNKGIAQPKIIEITKEWRRFSMTTVPQNWTNGFPQ